MDVPKENIDIGNFEIDGQKLSVGNDGEQAQSEHYEKALQELIAGGMNPRKARRYLDSVAKRNLKKFLKKAKNRAGTITKIETD